MNTKSSKLILLLGLLSTSVFLPGCKPQSDLTSHLFFNNYNKFLRLGGVGYEYWVDLISTKETLLLAGNTFKSFTDNRDIFVSCLDTTGNIKNAVVLGGTHAEYFNKILSEPNSQKSVVLATTESLFFTFMKHLGGHRSQGGIPILFFLDSDLTLTHATQFSKNSGLAFLNGLYTGQTLMLTGYTENESCFIAQLNSKGFPLFAKQYFEGRGTAVFSQDNHYLVTAQDRASTPIIFYINSQGDLRWAKKITIKDQALKLKKTCYFKNTLYILGYFENYTGLYYVLIQLDKEGNLLQSHIYKIDKEIQVFDISVIRSQILISGMKGNPKNAFGVRLHMTLNGEVENIYIFDQFPVQTLDRTVELKDTLISAGLLVEPLDDSPSDFYVSYNKKSEIPTGGGTLNLVKVLASHPIEITPFLCAPEDITLEASEIPTPNIEYKGLPPKNH